MGRVPGAPGTRGNAVGVFRAYPKTQEDPEIKELVNYPINWVAGTKLIFVVLIIGIIITGSPETQVYSTIPLIFSIATFFSQLYPVLQTMDDKDELRPRGHSRTLAIMIGSFITVFAVAVADYNKDQEREWQTRFHC